MTDNKAYAVVVLKPVEAKRLIAKAVVQLPEVANALKNGKVVVTLGSTNAFVVEEILHEPLSDKYKYYAGVISQGELGIVPEEMRYPSMVLVKGQKSDIHAREIVEEFGSDDVYIKGANAVDPEGNVGILLGSETAGTTVGKSLPILFARGSHLIVPVGLEKLVPSVKEAAKKCGIRRLKYATGTKVGYMAVVSAKVITEIQAFQILSGVQATLIASGGHEGGEGSTVFALEGDEENITKAFELIRAIKSDN